jgi:hypothetical protein
MELKKVFFFFFQAFLHRPEQKCSQAHINTYSPKHCQLPPPLLGALKRQSREENPRHKDKQAVFWCVWHWKLKNILVKLASVVCCMWGCLWAYVRAHSPFWFCSWLKIWAKIWANRCLESRSAGGEGATLMSRPFDLPLSLSAWLVVGGSQKSGSPELWFPQWQGAPCRPRGRGADPNLHLPPRF